MTFKVFATIFAALAVQLRFTDADEATARGYYDVLKDLEPEFIALAAKQMARQGGAITEKAGESTHWFPKTSEWYAAARKVEADRTSEQRDRLSKLSTPLCLACDDTGWARDGDAVSRCSCANMRRLEVLGRRPMPALPPADDAAMPDPTVMTRIRAMVAPLATTHTVRPGRRPRKEDNDAVQGPGEG